MLITPLHPTNYRELKEPIDSYTVSFFYFIQVEWVSGTLSISIVWPSHTYHFELIKGEGAYIFGEVFPTFY
jgi:hypothetical protein